MSNMENALNQRMHELHDLSAQLNASKREEEKKYEHYSIEEKRRINEL